MEKRVKWALYMCLSVCILLCQGELAAHISEEIGHIFICLFFSMTIWRKRKVFLKMRRLNRKKTLNLVKELDAFPKVPDSYVETSASGGTGELSSDWLKDHQHVGAGHEGAHCWTAHGSPAFISMLCTCFLCSCSAAPECGLTSPEQSSAAYTCVS